MVSLISELSHLIRGTRRWKRLDAVQVGAVGNLSEVDSGEDADLKKCEMMGTFKIICLQFWLT